jgi:hypothetical protein
MEKKEALIEDYIQTLNAIREDVTYNLEKLNGLSNDVFLLKIF